MTIRRRILFADGPVHKGEDEDDDDEVEDDVGVGDDDDCYANSPTSAQRRGERASPPSVSKGLKVRPQQPKSDGTADKT